jgi:hypothetical protein
MQSIWHVAIFPIAPSNLPVECFTHEFFRNLLDGEREGAGPSSAEVLGYASQ